MHQMNHVDSIELSYTFSRQYNYTHYYTTLQLHYYNYSTLAKFMKKILLPTEMVLKTEN